jgi:simple sugar transport system ATP-binding protein
VIVITCNVRHAHAIGDTVTVLNRGKTLGTRTKGHVNSNELQTLMASKELQTRSAELGGTI